VARSKYFVGVGVSKDKIEHIFDAFSQVQDGQVTGTGLGLFGVRTRAEGLHGACGARHNPRSPTGTGTIIWFAIPYKCDRAAEIAYHARNLSRSASRSTDLDRELSTDHSAHGPSHSVPSPQCSPDNLRMSPQPAHTGKRQLTAIVVDDTLTVRKLMEKLLLRMGFTRVDCYENGSKGLDAMMAGQVDIVFSDVQMPIMTGPEVGSMHSVSPRYQSCKCCLSFASGADVVEVSPIRGGLSGLWQPQQPPADRGGDRQRLTAGQSRRAGRLRRSVSQTRERRGHTADHSEAPAAVTGTTRPEAFPGSVCGVGVLLWCSCTSESCRRSWIQAWRGQFGKL
jgi:hypothetical protein